MAEWTIETVADRFIEAARTAQRLPPVRVQGYFNCWPTIVRMPWENLGEEPPLRYYPPDPAAVDRMLETMQWVQWLEEEQRHIVWMRAQRYPWKEICCRFGCDRTTAWRRWQKALEIVAEHLQTARKHRVAVHCH